MAGGWGSYSADNIRLGVFWDGIEVSPDGSKARITNPKVRVHRKNTVTAKNNIAFTNSAALGSNTPAVANKTVETATSLNGSGEMDLFTAVAAWIDLTYGATVAAMFDAAMVYDVKGSGLWYTETCAAQRTVTYPARAWQLPTAPTGLTVTRNSDTSHLIAWTNTPTTPAPYTNVVVQRQEYTATGWGAWATVATVAGTATQWTDTGTVANRRYQWRVRGSNSSGLGAVVTSGTYSTTPAAPTGIALAKSGTNITVTWTNQALYQTHVYIEHKEGGTWGAPEALAGSPTSKTYTSVNPAVTHQFRLRAFNGLYSDYLTSGEMGVNAPPLAPTVTVTPAVLDATLTALVASWVHNPTDYASQTGYKLRYSVNGANSWTELTGTTATNRTIAAGTLTNGQTYEIQAATKGADPAYGPWSSSRLVSCAATPSATLGVIDTTVSRPEVTWSYAGATAQSAWQVTLYNAANEVLEQRNGSGAAASATFGHILADATPYRVGVAVADGIGLWSVEAATTWTTSLIPPPPPTMTAEYDPDTGKATLYVTAPAPAVAVEIWRDGTRIARTAPTDVFEDTIPPTDHAVVYVAVAWADPPVSTASAPLVIDTTTAWVFLNAGSAMARLKANPTVRAEVQRDKVLHTFAGYESPEEFTGEAITRTYEITGEVDGYGNRPELGDWRAFETVATMPAPVCYRDPFRRIFGSIGKVSIDHDARKERATVSFTLTEVGHVE